MFWAQFKKEEHSQFQKNIEPFDVLMKEVFYLIS